MKLRLISFCFILILLFTLSACKPQAPVGTDGGESTSDTTAPADTAASTDTEESTDTDAPPAAERVVTAGDFRTEVFADGHMLVSYDPDASAEVSSPLKEPMTFTCSALPPTDFLHGSNTLLRVMFRTELDGVAFVLLDAGMNQSRYAVFVTADGGKTFTVLCHELHISGMIDSAAYGEAGLLCVSAEGADRAHGFLLPTEPVTEQPYTPTYQYLTEEHAVGTHNILITAVTGSSYTVTWTTPDDAGVEQPQQGELSFS